MNLTIELDREVDGRWIAEIPELNVLLYGSSRQDAIQRAEEAARRIIDDRVQRGTLPAEAANVRSEGQSSNVFGGSGKKKLNVNASA